MHSLSLGLDSLPRSRESSGSLYRTPRNVTSGDPGKPSSCANHRSL